jgi:molybdenum cofactor biosynthesis enzyme MoaA
MDNNIKNSIDIKNQAIQLGSSHITQREEKKFNREKFMLDNMENNLAYKLYLNQNDIKDIDNKVLSEFKERYKKYRYDWYNEADHQYNLGINFENDQKSISNPLCMDIEIASICDLACPHCFREHIITPDKIMPESMFNQIIDSIKEMDVPSIKLNWRGEPLLNPKICDFIKYAKKNKILEVIINTNATQLDEKTSKNLIESGLDQVIFSFDGGTEKTYNAMRPGRFRKNTFDQVYNNIKKFDEIKKKLQSPFPTTKIQMVLTEDTRSEIESFYNLFNDFVDDVTVIQYNERGGEIKSLKDSNQKKLKDFIGSDKMAEDTPFMVTADDSIFVSKFRKPCEQLFQRLMITYDGKVGMCCHDWGAQHCLGYVNEKAFTEDKEIEKIKVAIEKNKKGFELLQLAKKPTIFNSPEKKISEIKSIWKGKELNRVRNLHREKKLNEVNVCKKCTFKDTYEWEKI